MTARRQDEAWRGVEGGRVGDCLQKWKGLNFQTTYGDILHIAHRRHNCSNFFQAFQCAHQKPIMKQPSNGHVQIRLGVTSEHTLNIYEQTQGPVWSRQFPIQNENKAQHGPQVMLTTSVMSRVLLSWLPTQITEVKKAVWIYECLCVSFFHGSLSNLKCAKSDHVVGAHFVFIPGTDFVTASTKICGRIIPESRAWMKFSCGIIHFLVDIIMQTKEIKQILVLSFVRKLETRENSISVFHGIHEFPPVPITKTSSTGHFPHFPHFPFSHSFSFSHFFSFDTNISQSASYQKID